MAPLEVADIRLPVEEHGQNFLKKTVFLLLALLLVRLPIFDLLRASRLLIRHEWHRVDGVITQGSRRRRRGGEVREDAIDATVFRLTFASSMASCAADTKMAKRPPTRMMKTTRVDGVKAPQRETPRSHLHQFAKIRFSKMTLTEVNTDSMKDL